MLIKAEETWGDLFYDTKLHHFSYKQNRILSEQPYVTQPIVLNCYVTHKCNMICEHCVARDMSCINKTDLIVNKNLINKINKSPFKVIVLTGGEPLLKEKEEDLLTLIDDINNKGIMIDTNGTILPSKKLLNLIKRKNVLVRISLDSTRSDDEIILRKSHKHPKKSLENYNLKIKNIEYLLKQGVNTSIQSVLTKKNYSSIEQIPNLLKNWGINQWYVQRLIPTTKIHPKEKNGRSEPFFIDNDHYERKICKLEKMSKISGLRCVIKKDRRHNCVYLLIGDGDIFTSSDKGTGRVCLGKIGKIKNYFEYVSSSEHSSRYY